MFFCEISEFLKYFFFWNISGNSNVNEVIRAVLNSLFFYEKILHARKASKSAKVPKAPKAPKEQRRNQAKAQNTTSEQ